MTKAGTRQRRAKSVTITTGRFDGLGTTKDIIAQLNQEWWSIPLVMRVLEMKKGTIDMLANKVGVLTSARLNGIKMVFRDDVLSIAHKPVEQIVAEAEGKDITRDLTMEPAESLGLKFLQLSRSQWDFYFRRRLAEREFEAPIYTSYGLEARCPFCLFPKQLKVTLSPTDGQHDTGQWVCKFCDHLPLQRFMRYGLGFELLLSTNGKPRQWSTRRLIEARGKVFAIAREATEQDYKSPNAPADPDYTSSSSDRTPAFHEETGNSER